MPDRACSRVRTTGILSARLAGRAGGQGLGWLPRCWSPGRMGHPGDAWSTTRTLGRSCHQGPCPPTALCPLPRGCLGGSPGGSGRGGGALPPQARLRAGNWRWAPRPFPCARGGLGDPRQRSAISVRSARGGGAGSASWEAHGLSPPHQPWASQLQSRLQREAAAMATRHVFNRARWPIC